MKPKLILLSHGRMAVETLNSAKMIAGENSDIIALEMTAEEGGDGITVKLTEVIGKLSGNKIIVAADLFGGTPFNVAALHAQQLKGKDIAVVAGFNLGMVVEYALSPEEDLLAMVQMLEDAGKASVQVLEITEINASDDGEIEF